MAWTALVDEKSQVQALDRSQLRLPAMLGRRTRDYTRNDGTSPVATGKNRPSATEPEYTTVYRK